MPTKHRHLIFGSGLIGGYLSGGLSIQNFDVSLVGRAHSQQAMADGITISNLHEDSAQLPSPKFIDVEQGTHDPFDVIWLTVKCTAIKSSISELNKLVGPNTSIICCQNGLGADLLVKSAFPNVPVLTALIGFNVAQPSPEHFHCSTDGKVVIEATPISQKIAEQANSAFLPTEVSHDIVAQQWAKLQLNLSNAVNALSDVPTKTMLEQQGYRKIIAGLMRELLHVADTKNIKLPQLSAVPAKWIPRVLSLPNWAFLRLGQRMIAVDPSARLSMWWDLSAGRKTEIDFLNLALVEEGKIQGINCPLNERISELINEVQSKQRKIAISAKELTQLLAVRN